jgi:hypothetical protein
VLSTEREGFEAQLAMLCAGFNVPATAERKDAYWRGLAKMSLPAFTRVVEYALGKDGPEDLPTSPRCWALLRELREQQRGGTAPTASPTPSYDQYHVHAQGWLAAFLVRRSLTDLPPLSDAEIGRLVATKNRVLQQYRASGYDGEDLREWRDVFVGAFESALKPNHTNDLHNNPQHSAA